MATKLRKRISKYLRWDYTCIGLKDNVVSCLRRWRWWWCSGVGNGSMWCGCGTGAEEEKEQEQDLKKHCPTRSFMVARTLLRRVQLLITLYNNLWFSLHVLCAYTYPYTAEQTTTRGSTFCEFTLGREAHSWTQLHALKAVNGNVLEEDVVKLGHGQFVTPFLLSRGIPELRNTCVWNRRGEGVHFFQEYSINLNTFEGKHIEHRLTSNMQTKVP